MRSNTFAKVLVTMLLIACCLVSLIIGDRFASQPKNHKHSIEVIDNDIDKVLLLTGAVTATSAVISAIPDDTCTPIANQLAGLSKYLLVIISILYLEKYMLSLTGVVSFIALIPLAILIWLIAIWTNRDGMKSVSIKLSIFALILYFIVPTSVYLTDKVYDVYETSINKTVDEATHVTEDSKGFLEKVKQVTTSATTYVSNVVNKFIESVAVLLVTTCLIPILVIMILFGATKILFNIDFAKYIREKMAADRGLVGVGVHKMIEQK